jgi:UDP-glucuronate decarboxylase
MKRRPDITVARETLGWEPKIMLEEGLVNTIKHFREVLGVVPS